MKGRSYINESSAFVGGKILVKDSKDSVMCLFQNREKTSRFPIYRRNFYFMLDGRTILNFMINVVPVFYRKKDNLEGLHEI